MTEEEGPYRIIDGRVHAIALPTKERTAKRIDGERDVLIVEGRSGGVGMQSFTFPLDFYLRKEIVSRRQWSAGDRLHRLWANGCLPGYIQVQYEENDGGGRRLEFTPPGAFAIEYRKAIAAIATLSARRVAYQVCCEGLFLKLCKQLGSPRSAQRKGMPLLIDALDDLAEHFSY